MENFTKNKTCTTWCWIIAAVVGAVVASVLWGKPHWNFVPSAFVGLLIFIIGGALLSWLLCKPQAQSSASSAVASNTTASSVMAGGAVAAAATGAAVASSASSASASAKPAAAKKAPAKKAVTAKPASSAVGSDAKAKAAVKSPANKAATKTTKTAAKATSAKAKAAAPAKTSAAKTKAAPAPKAEAKPATLTAARAGGADDLKQLKGVGPALEKTLNELGFYHFDQVATWKKKDVAWVDSNLRFKGRIERDGWIAQAKILAKGGTTEFSSKVKKGGVY